MRRLTYLIAVALLAILILAPHAGAQQKQTVSIRDFNFSPASITVKPGTTVTWVNQGQANHTVTHNGGAFDSGTLHPGQSYSHKFNKAGSYDYHCEIHSSMRGTIIVGGWGGGVAFFGSSPTATASPTTTGLVATNLDSNKATQGGAW